MSMEEKQNSLTFQDFSQSVLKPETREDISLIIQECYKKNIPIEINCLQSKKNIGRNFQAEKTLNLSNYKGIIEYKPEELYIKVKAGTPIREIKAELDKHNQQLAFEPNDFGPLFKGKHEANIIIHQAYKNFPNNTYIDVGSSLNPFMPGIESRREYHKILTNPNFAIEECIW